ncbi:type 1 glutamine amidotransferase domain-containing protein [Parapedobacter sp. 10938]|uniref:type 1 glutamine amidotransferase domain-containing protein n=1 Tax=Parapedobacter flavus TaxID=3110225 RepID=UPI002DBEC0FA|nr:type 1 glutamine amidotransferase domain-containing protein [Parapedobacter sp. 10938]MEC3879655.1 type 1 glutamine amidotransferase domain-containing protein [Parapedobacter sp. 10938]
MADELKDRKVAILTADGFEEVELTSPRDAIQMAGGKTYIVSPNNDVVRAMKGKEWSLDFDVDVPLEQAMPDDYDALLVPGGVINPDKLRVIDKALDFVRSFFDAGKPVAAICHGPQVLIDADVVAGRKMTSVNNIRRDLMNAGARWEDRAVVVDQGLVTSRTPHDLPDFNGKVIEEFAEGKHAGQHA